MNQRFTIDGDARLEEFLAGLCDRAREGILRLIPERRLVAIVLAGGYGRGEGGVLKTGGGDQPYNDLEFYIIVTGPAVGSRHWDHSLHELAESLSQRAGIEVEFKVLPLAKLRRSPVTMFYYDLITSHRLVYGDESYLASCNHHRAAHRIPLHEALRLLMNRCSGLLYAQERLSRANFSEVDADFVGRNLAKAKLALGDVFLAMRGQYHYSCRERHKRLRKLAADGGLHDFQALLPLHAEGVEFKLHPSRLACDRAEFALDLESLKEIARDLWLRLEHRRLQRTFPDLQTYTFDPSNKCPETLALKNRLINLRRFGLGHGLCGRYPRERLLNTLPILLWHTDSMAEPRVISFVQRQLHTAKSDFPGLVQAYESLWRIYN